MVAKKNEVAKAKDESKELAVGFDWQEDAGAGLEEVDADSIAIPFLRVLQKTSPQVDEGSSEYDENARPGMLYNTVSGKLYDGKTGVTLQPIHFFRRFLKWGPRGTDGAGFKGEYTPEDVDELIEQGRIVEYENALYEPLEDGGVDPNRCNVYNDTRSHFVHVVEGDGKLTQALIALNSTQIKKSKRLIGMLRGTMIEGKNPPSFMQLVRAKTAIESNEKGSWSGIIFDFEKIVDDPNLYAAGKAFYKSVTEGKTKVAYEAMGDEAAPDEGGDSGAF